MSTIYDNTCSAGAKEQVYGVDIYMNIFCTLYIHRRNGVAFIFLIVCKKKEKNIYVMKCNVVLLYMIANIIKNIKRYQKKKKKL